MIGDDMAYWGDRDYLGDGYESPSYLSPLALVTQKDRRRAPNKASSTTVVRAINYGRLKIVAASTASELRTEPRSFGEDASLRKEFKKLVRQWRADTMLISSPREMAVHPAYQRIIALGAPAIPMIIEELRANGGHWFWALRFLANHDPVPKKNWGNVPEMKNCWLAWWDAKQVKVANAA